MALVEPWGRIGVALEWLWSRNRLAINTLCGGFDIALGGFGRRLPVSTVCITSSGGVARRSREAGSYLPGVSGECPVCLPGVLDRFGRCSFSRGTPGPQLIKRGNLTELAESP